MIYKANIQYHRPAPQGEVVPPQEVILLFVANDIEDAVKGAWRWCRNRQQAFPAHFKSLISLKVSRFLVDRIDEHGFLPNPATAPMYSWSAVNDVPAPRGEGYDPKPRAG